MSYDFYNFMHMLHAFISVLVPFGFLNYFTYLLVLEVNRREFTWLILASLIALNLFSFFVMQIDRGINDYVKIVFQFSYYSSYIALAILLYKAFEVILGFIVDTIFWIKDSLVSALKFLFITKLLSFFLTGIKFMLELFLIQPLQSLFAKPEFKVKSKVFNNSKNQKPIARGGEAKIYATSRNTLAKIFLPNQAISNKLNTITMLMQLQLPNNIATASYILNDVNNNFIGYEMQKLKGVELGLLFLPNGMKKHFKKYNLIDLLTLSISILDLFEVIHQESLIVGDINPRNILVESKDKVALIDTDSFQVGKPSGVGQAIYTRAINIGRPYSSYLRTIADDTYAISVIIFQILHYGALPYGSSNIDDLKYANYLYSPNSHTNHNVNPELVKAHHRLSLELKNYFHTQFKEQVYKPLASLKKGLKVYRKTLLKQ